MNFQEQAIVLVVDDDADNVRILETFLKSSGYKTDHAYTGQEALEKINEIDFDLILLDVMLPDTTGYQICEKLKSTPQFRDIPITVVTALDKQDDKLKFLNMGAEDFLSKPIDEKELLVKVKKQILAKQILDKTRREKRELKSLSNILSINYYEKDVEAILDMITIETSFLLDSDRTTIFLKSGKFLISKSAQGLFAGKQIVVPISSGIVGHVARTGEVYVANDLDNEPLFNKEVDKKTGYKTKRIITFPILHNDRVIGAIQSLNKKKPYANYDVEMLKKIADHTANILIRFYAEKKLKESERLHRNLMDRLSNAIFTVDSQDRINYVNNAFCKLTGFHVNEIMRKDIKILFIPSDLQSLNEMGEKVKNVESHILNKEFELIPIEVTITGYEIDSKKHGRVFSIFDLRDKYQLEKQEIQMKTIQEDFNSMIIHDLKNPLSVIVGYSELLTNQTDEKLTSRQIDYINKIVQSSEHVLKLTNEMLEVSKYESGMMSLKTSFVNILEILEEVANSQSLTFKKKNINYINNAIELPGFLADSEKLRRLFTNLIGNALKFTDYNGTITCNYKLFKIQNVEFVEIEIKDNGVGIPLEDINQIFVRYKQSSKNSKLSGDDGSGLGLTICKMIAEGHKGSIRVTSEENVGTSFYVSLPVVLV
jgi:PAS domain S-box-containing protein